MFHTPQTQQSSAINTVGLTTPFTAAAPPLPHPTLSHTRLLVTCGVDCKGTFPCKRVEEVHGSLGRPEVGKPSPFEQHEVFEHVEDLSARLPRKEVQQRKEGRKEGPPSAVV